jgi:hypothetical protein
MFWIIKAALSHQVPGFTIGDTASAKAYVPAPDHFDCAGTTGAISNFSGGLA